MRSNELLFCYGGFHSDNWIHTTEKCSDNKHSDWVLVIGLLREQKGSKSIIFWDETREIKWVKIAKKVGGLHRQKWILLIQSNESESTIFDEKLII